MTYGLLEMEKHLVATIQKEHDVPGWLMRHIPRMICDGIQEALCRGEKVRLERIGTIETKLRKERHGRNPKTGETLRIPVRMGAKFRASKDLVNSMNGIKVFNKAKKDIPAASPITEAEVIQDTQELGIPA
jgi:nucleoid DNA-binding protein